MTVLFAKQPEESFHGRACRRVSTPQRIGTNIGLSQASARFSTSSSPAPAMFNCWTVMTSISGCVRLSFQMSRAPRRHDSQDSWRDGSIWLLDCALPACPVSWPSFLVCDSHDDDVIFVDSIVNAERKSFEHDATRAVECDWVAMRCLANSSNCHRDLEKEAGRGQETALLVPRLGLLDLIARSRMKANTHSTDRAGAGALPPTEWS